MSTLGELVNDRNWHHGTHGEQIFIAPDVMGGNGWLLRAAGELAQLRVALADMTKDAKKWAISSRDYARSEDYDTDEEDEWLEKYGEG